MPDLSWTCARLQDLGPLDVHDLLTLRSAVFVIEQNCVFLDPDGADRQSWHLLGRDPQGRLLAGLRLVDPGVKYPEPSMGRVVTDLSVRGQGCGRELVRQGLAHAHRLWPGQGIRISAQARLERFYLGFDFQTVSQPYLEDDIPHLEMLRAPTTKEPT